MTSSFISVLILVVVTLLGKGEAAEGAIAALAVIEKPIKRYLELTIETCAYAGSANPLQVRFRRVPA